MYRLNRSWDARRSAAAKNRAAAALLCLIALLVTAVPAAASVRLPEGIYNESVYEEVILLTGEPVVVTGTRQENVSSNRNGNGTVRINFKLASEDGDYKVTRSVTYNVQTEQRPDGQSVRTISVSRFSETVTTPAGSYRLADYQYHRSEVTDRRPAMAYTAGNWTERRHYTLGQDGATVTVEGSGDIFGYLNEWGETETLLGEVLLTANGTVSWQGQAEFVMTATRTKDLVYVKSDPLIISFAGGHLLTGQEQQSLHVTATLPVFDSDGAPRQGAFRTTTVDRSLETVPTQQRLPVADKRDLAGHWSEPYMSRLFALRALSPGGQYAGPNLPMQRIEFARAITVLAGLEPAEIVEETTFRGRPAPIRRSPGGPVEEPPPPFLDVDPDSPDFRFVKAAADNGIVMGGGHFYPFNSLTRAQAVTMLVRALGLEGRAPAAGYVSPYLDEADIPYWARDAVAVATQFRLVQGDTFGYFHPNQAMTRGEASAMLSRFLDFLREDVRLDYKERLTGRR